MPPWRNIAADEPPPVPVRDGRTLQRQLVEELTARAG